jgi:hypothetical protein
LTVTSPTDRPTKTAPPLLWLLGGTLLAAALLMQTAACGSIDDGGESATATYQLQSLEQPCAETDGLTGGELLDRIDDPYAAPLSFPERDRAATARLKVSYDGGALTCIPGHRGNPPGSARLEMEVDLRLQTDDGALSQTLPGTISVLADSDQVRFLGSSPLDADDASKVLLEGWLSTDADDSQGAFRLVDAHGESPEYHTVASWNTTRTVE